MNSHEEAELLETVKSIDAIYSKSKTRSFVSGMRIEAKAAYHIRIIADQLLKATVCIATKATTNLPNDIGFYIFATRKLFEGDADKITIVELGQIEDLYYAACAKVQEHHEEIILRLNNGFAKSEDFYFTHGNPLFPDFGPVAVGVFRASLEAQNKALRSQCIVGPLEHAVKLKHKYETMFRQSLNGYVSPSRVIESLELATGLRDTTKMSVGMIFGSLAEKHRLAVASRPPTAPAFVAPAVTDDTVMLDVETSPTHDHPTNGDYAGESIKISAPACTCADSCLCKPLCWINDNQSCQCQFSSNLAPTGATCEYLGPPCEDEAEQGYLTLGTFVFSASESISQPSLHPIFASAANPEGMVDALPSDPKTSRPPSSVKSATADPLAINMQESQAKKQSVPTKSRQSVNKRERKASHCKTKRDELPISTAALEKLKLNNFPMSTQGGEAKGEENHNATVAKPLNASKGSPAATVCTDKVSCSDTEMRSANILRLPGNKDLDHLQIDPLLTDHEQSAFSFDDAPTRKPAVALQTTTSQIIKPGKAANDMMACPSLIAQSVPMENLSIWAPRLSAEASMDPVCSTYGSTCDEIETYMATDGDLASFSTVPANQGFRWMQDFNNEVLQFGPKANLTTQF